MKKILSTLKGNKHASPPIWLMRQAGRYLPEYRKVRQSARDFLDLCYTPDLAVEVTLQPIRRFSFDAAILFSDILVVPDGLGQKTWFADGEGPRLDPLKNQEDLKKLSPSRMVEYLQPVYDSVKILKNELPGDVALIGFAGAPWTVSTYMIGGRSQKNFNDIILFAEKNSDFFDKLLSLLTDATIVHLQQQIANGAEIVQIFDSWAGVLIGKPDDYEKWVINPILKIVKALRLTHPDIPIIAFPKGSEQYYKDFGNKIAPTALSIDHNISQNMVRDDIIPLCERGSVTALQGNLSPDLLLSANGSELTDATKNILTLFKDVPHIFNLGHGIHKETPIAHVETLIDAVRGGNHR